MLLFKKDLINVVKAAKGYVTSVANTNSKTLNKLDLKNAIKLSPKFTGTLFVNTNVAGGKLNLTITCLMSYVRCEQTKHFA
jgi:hypothetical protein